METKICVNDIFSTQDYKKSRRAYALECAFEYFVALLVADSFLAKLLTAMGFSDAQTGLVSSFISLAFLFQLLAIPVVQRIRNVKRFSTLFHGLGSLLFMCLYLVPFLPADPGLRRLLAVSCLLLAYLGNYLVTSVIYRWGNSYVAPDKRARFSANKEIISLIAGIVVSLGFGFAMDRFEAEAQLDKGFLFAAAGIFIFSVCDFVCLLMIRNDTLKMQEVRKEPMLQVLRVLFQSKSFRSIVLLNVLWNAACYLTIGFLGTFKLTELMYTVSQVQIINLAGSLAQIALSRPFGSYSDRHSYAKGMEAALVMAIAAFAFVVGTNQTTRWLIIGYTLLYCACRAGMCANLINITYTCIDKQYFVQANALKNSIGGLCGFGASVLGSRVLALVQANGNQVFGMPLYGQQVLALISVGMLIAALMLTRNVIGKMDPAADPACVTSPGGQRKGVV